MFFFSLFCLVIVFFILLYFFMCMYIIDMSIFSFASGSHRDNLSRIRIEWNWIIRSCLLVFSNKYLHWCLAYYLLIHFKIFLFITFEFWKKKSELWLVYGPSWKIEPNTSVEHLRVTTCYSPKLLPYLGVFKYLDHKVTSPFS